MDALEHEDVCRKLHGLASKRKMEMDDTQENIRGRGLSTHRYFAYGSNLDDGQMRPRCPSARLVGPAILDGYRLGFAGYSRSWGGGVATVVRDEEARVPGLVWAITARDLERLDRFEGHPVAYARRPLWVELEPGARQRVHVYIKEAAEPTTPTEALLRRPLARLPRIRLRRARPRPRPRARAMNPGASSRSRASRRPST